MSLEQHESELARRFDEVSNGHMVHSVLNGMGVCLLNLAMTMANNDRPRTDEQWQQDMVIGQSLADACLEETRDGSAVVARAVGMLQAVVVASKRHESYLETHAERMIDAARDRNHEEE